MYRKNEFVRFLRDWLEAREAVSPPAWYSRRCGLCRNFMVWLREEGVWVYINVHYDAMREGYFGGMPYPFADTNKRIEWVRNFLEEHGNA